MNTEELVGLGKKYILNTARSEPIVIKEGKGATVKDITGKEYLDFYLDYAVHVGYGHPKLIEAIKEQLDELTGAFPTFWTLPEVKLAKLLAEIAPTGLVRSFISGGGGSIANETAYKLAKRYEGRSKFVSCWGSYHGCTAAMTALSGFSSQYNAYDQVFPGFIHVPLPYCYRCHFGLEYPDCNLCCAEMIETAIYYEADVAAVMMEPINTAQGVIIPPNEYLRRVRDICDEHNVLLILDEVVTGFGRSGKMFGCEHFNVVPDMMTLSKGMSSCYVECCAVMVKEKTAEGLGLAPEASAAYVEGGWHAFTSTNHPLACATALANINIILDEKLVDNSAVMGKYLLERIEDMAEEHEFLGEVRGKGLLIGVEVVKDKESRVPDVQKGKQIAERALERGLIIPHRSGRIKNASVIVFNPPISVTTDELDRALEIFEQATG